MLLLPEFGWFLGGLSLLLFHYNTFFPFIWFVHFQSELNLVKWAWQNIWLVPRPRACKRTLLVKPNFEYNDRRNKIITNLNWTELRVGFNMRCDIYVGFNMQCDVYAGVNMRRDIYVGFNMWCGIYVGFNMRCDIYVGFNMWCDIYVAFNMRRDIYVGF